MSSSRPLIIAHRGASRYAPENTLAAFDLAWQQGADGIECDVHQTLDEKIVCIHDFDTKRVGSRDLVVSESALADLQSMDVGSWKDRKWQGEGIPTLEAALRKVPAGKRAFIEIKTDKRTLPAFYRVLEATAFDASRATVIAFDEAVIRQLKKDLPEMRAYWLTHFKGDDEGGFHPGIAKILDTLCDIKADGLGAENSPAVNGAFADALRREGKELNIWTVDKIEEAQRYQELGVDSLSTNDPITLLKAL